jgi:arylsulfatase A-like enzyme
MLGDRPNILLVVSDQERQRGWLPNNVNLPWRERLIAEGLEFTRYYTHSSPCSPSRASLFTGRYLPGHRVVDNVIQPEHTELDQKIPTIGSMLRGAGYRSSYIGKWHLSHSATPDMAAYGFADWEGNDKHFMGWAGTGVAFDPIIAGNAAHWISANARNGSSEQPWFLTVALVNPHDVMWFPIDQPGYEEAHPEEVGQTRKLLTQAAWKEDDPLPIYSDTYEEIFEELPENFDDDLHTKPEAHRQWRYDQQHGIWGMIDPLDKDAWLRHLDYYVELHRQADRSLGVVLKALEDAGAWDDTVVIFTSDHGDMCGSHGLRSKGPFVYEEIMRVPLYIKVPGVTRPGSTTESLATHVDLATTICGIAGADPYSQSEGTSSSTGVGIQGVDLQPVLDRPGHSVRDHVLFAQDSAQTERLNGVRYALRGFFDGKTKYARYYGIGGGKPSTGLWGKDPGKKLFDADSDFDDQDHEWYDHSTDPFELVNLANDRGLKNELRKQFERLRTYEREELEWTGI